jgi:hypothetical protein
MGIDIKRKKINGVEMYQLRSTISDELYHTEDWVTVDGAKKALMESQIWNFCEKLVEIDIEFPHAYHIGDKPPKIYSDKTIQRFCEYALNNYYGKGGGKKLNDDFHAIINRLGIEIQDLPEIKYGLYRIKIDGNGMCDRSTLEAISDSEEKLKNFCKVNFSKEVGKPEIFSWDDYYVIQPYKMKVV